jgi:hypothetical protein
MVIWYGGGHKIMDAYSYVSSGGGMIILLLILGAIMIYLLFSKGFWLDRFMQNDKEPLIHQDDTGVPHITSPTNKPTPKGKKRKYKKRSKKK